MSSTPHHRSKNSIQPTGIDRPWGDEEIIVSKTDAKGLLTYANDVFQRVSLIDAEHLIGKPHNIIRHPAMPRCIFKLLWETISSKQEMFAYVLNMASNGDQYWVFAHVTPSYDNDLNVIGYHSNRRKPTAEQIAKIQPLYAALLAEEQKHSSPRAAIDASTALLEKTLEQAGMRYDEFIFSL